jgi:spore germination protein KC
LALALIVPLSGCREITAFFPHMSEVTDLEVVQVLGIDRSSRNPEEFEVTIVAGIEVGTDGSEEGVEKTSEVITAYGATVYEAVTQLDVYTDKRQHLGYVDFLLIGEEIARQDISSCTDYFIRNHESRFSTKIFIVRDSTAREFLTKTTTKSQDVSAMLGNFDETISATSASEQLSSIDFVNMLDMETRVAVVPALRCEAHPGSNVAEGDAPHQTFAPAGYAIIKDFRLVDYIDLSYSLGYSILKGRMFTAPVSVFDKSGKLVGIEMLREHVKFKTDWRDGRLVGVRYDINLEGNITEQLGLGDIYSSESLTQISDAASRLVKTEIENVIKKTHDVGRDFLGIGEKVRMKNPVKWEYIAEWWNDIYPSVDIQVNVTCMILRPYDIREPNGYNVEDEIAGEKDGVNYA